jgi:hypothetical protein
LIYTYQVQNDDYSGLYAKSFSARGDGIKFVEEYMAHPLIAKYHLGCPQDSFLFIDYNGMPES